MTSIIKALLRIQQLIMYKVIGSQSISTDSNYSLIFLVIESKSLIRFAYTLDPYNKLH